MTDYPKATGKLIVIDGTDGAGKATQTELLIDKLKNSGYRVEMISFPQHGEKSAGLTEEYLNGRFGGPDDVDPYVASTFYAVDRYAASFKIKHWLDEGKIIISNRYVTANMGHQGCKIKDPVERQKFFAWLDNLEYGIFKIPKPDLNIILHLDAAQAQQLVDQKESRAYINGQKRDIHEADLGHLLAAEKIYLEIAHQLPNFALIECANNNQLMSKEQIAQLIWAEVTKII